MRNLAKKTHFQIFAQFVRNDSNKHHYIPQKFCFCYFCPKRLFAKLFVVEVDVLLASSRIILNHDGIGEKIKKYAKLNNIGTITKRNTLIILHKNTLIEIKPHLFLTKTAN